MTDEKNVFIASGKEYDRDRLLDVIANNTEGYARHRQQMQPERRNMFGKVKQQGFDIEGFRQAVDDIKKEITNGKLSMDSGNLFRHSDGLEWKDPLHTAALDLVSKSVAALSEEKQEKPKYSNTRIFDRFNNKFYGGNFNNSSQEQNFEMWANGTRGVNDIKQLLDEEIADVEQNELDYTGSPFSDRNQHLERLRALRTSLDNGVDQNDIANWVALGGDEGFFRTITGLTKPAKTIEEENAERKNKWIEEQLREDPSLTREELEEEYNLGIALRKEERNKRHLEATEESDWDNYANKTFTSTASENWSLKNYNNGKARGDKFWMGSDEGEGFIKKNQNTITRIINDFKRRGIVNKGVKIGNTDVTEDEALMASLYYNIKSHPNDYILAKDGSYIIKSTIQPDGTAYRYNPKTRTLYKYHATKDTETLNKYFYDQWKKSRYAIRSSWKHKQGGTLNKMKVLKALSGEELVQQSNEYIKKDTERVKKQAQSEGKTYKQYKAAKRKVIKEGEEGLDLDTTTSLRLAGAVADISSAVAAFAPGYGTAASGALSLAGIGADLAADMTDDSISAWDVVKNTAFNVGVGVAGLVPVIGPSGKFAKVAKTVIRCAPVLLAVGSAFSGYDDAKKIIGKIKDNKDVTVEEWTQLGRWIASVAGSTRFGAQALKTHALRSRANKTTTQTETTKIKTTKGEIELTADDKVKLSKASSPEEANTIFKNLKGEDAGEIKYDKSLQWKFWNGRKTSSELPIFTEESNTTTYDFSPIRSTRTFGTQGRTRLGLNSDIDMLTGQGGLFGINRFRISPSSNWWNPYTWGQQRGEITSITQRPSVPITQHTENTQQLQNRFNAEVLRTYNPYTGQELRGKMTTPIYNRISTTNLNNYKDLARQSGVKITNEENFKNFVIELRKVNANFKNMLQNPRFMQLSKEQFKFKKGGKLDALKELRVNFTIDNSNASDGLSKFKLGGIMKYQGGGQSRKQTGVLFTNGTGADWLKDIFIYGDDLLEKIKKNGDNAVNDINSMQDRHYKIYTDAQKSGNWQQTAYTDGSGTIKAYQTDYDNYDKYGYNTKQNLDAISKAYSNGRYSVSGKRTSGDGPEHGFTVDDLFSAITDDRRILGRKDDWDEDSDEFKAYQKKLNELGYEMYLDKDKTDYYKIRKLNSNSDNSEEGKKQGISRADPGTHTVYEDNNDYGLDKYAKALQKAAPEALSMFRFLKNLNNNKKIRDLALQKQPAYLEPIYKHKNVYGDFWALVNAQKNAANTQSKAQNIAENTSDSQLAALTQLEGQRNANQEKLRGVAADNAAIKQSIQEHDAVNDAMYDYNHKVADENNARMVAKINSDIDARMGYHSANTTNWNNWLSEHEQRFRINQNDAKQRQLADYAQRMADWQADQIKNDPEYQRMYQEYTSTTDASKREQLLKDMREFQYNRSLEMQPILRQMRSRYILGINIDDDSIFNNLYAGTSDYKIKTKHGGRLTVDSSRMKYRADDLRELRKQIKHNIDTNRKALDNLSRATLLELKKMMGI